MATEDLSLLRYGDGDLGDAEAVPMAAAKETCRWRWRPWLRTQIFVALGVSTLVLYLWPFERAAAGVSQAIALEEVNSILPEVAVQPYGVLGVQLDSLHHFVRQAAEPWGLTAVLDPAGLRFIHDIGPAGAGGASRAIYSWLRINLDPRFPGDVREGVQKECDAKMHKYSDKQVIHVVGPDFTNVPWASFEAQAEASQKLTTAYKHVLEEFEASDAQRLRLLPISGGINAGPFFKQLPQLTFEAIDKAFRSLPMSSQHHLLQRFKKHKLEMCIFEETSLAAYQAACPTCA